MGQSEGKSNKHDYSKFKERFVIKKKLIDKKYGEGMLVEDKTTKLDSFLKEYITPSSNEFQELYAKICIKENIKNPYIIEIIDYFTNKETHYCSEYHKLYVLFEFCNKNLEMEIQDRASDNNHHFSNEEMLYITESYITGLSFLQTNKIFHSNINLQSLLISKNGIYKVADQSLLNMPSNLDQFLLKKFDNSGIYLAPALIQVFLLKSFL